LPPYIERGAAEVAVFQRSVEGILIDDARPRDVDQQRAVASCTGADSGSLMTRRWREMDSNHRSPARKSRFFVAEGELRDRTGAAKNGCFLCGTDGSNPSPSSGESGANRFRSFPCNWDTGPLGNGEEKAITFTEPGTYFYICTPHPRMYGQVIVEQGAGTAALPSRAAR
jgi:plastocyanin